MSNSNTQTYDVCPKGWRLPTESEFSGITSYSSAFSPVKSGYYLYGSPYDAGSYGGWWSATSYPNDAYRRYYLFYNGSSLNTNNVNRDLGYSVRCIRKSAVEIAWEESGKPTMQDFTSADASTMNTGDTKVLADTRDNQLYTVSKLADGKVWMLDNLALGSASTMTLTNSDTNITASSWTLPAGITSGFNSYTAAQINVASKDTAPSTKYGSGSGKIGVYYNYCAASAGGICTSSNSSNGSADRDICPKGWRLPTGGSSGEFQTLYNAYGNHTDFTTALSTPLSGNFSGGSASNQGNVGYWWSSTRSYNADMYSLHVAASNVHPQIGDDRSFGFSIRCILK